MVFEAYCAVSASNEIGLSQSVYAEKPKSFMYKQKRNTGTSIEKRNLRSVPLSFVPLVHSTGFGCGSRASGV